MKELLGAINQKRQEVEKLRDIMQELSTAEEDLVPSNEPLRSSAAINFLMNSKNTSHK